MTKAEFLKTLEEGLAGASAEERVAAMQYFTEYLDDAGPEREAGVLAELGDPTKVAADIMAVAGGELPEARALPAAAAPAPLQAQQPGSMPHWMAAVADVFSSLGQPPKAPVADVYPPEPQRPQPPPAPPPPQPAGPAVTGTAYDAARPLPAEGKPGYSGPEYDTSNSNVAKIILIVLACIFLSPLLAGVFSVLLGLLVAAVALFLCPFIVGGAMAIAALPVLVLGAMLIPANAGGGLFTVGTAVFVLGLGLLCLYGGGLLMGKTLPWLVRSASDAIRAVWNKLFGKKKAGA